MRKLIVEIDKCLDCPECPVECNYPYHVFTKNNGIEIIREQAAFALICRRCDEAPCVSACPTGALKKDGSDYTNTPMVRRANMLCTGCHSCTLVCPFGVIYPEFIPYLVSKCDLCVKRVSEGERTLCVDTCPHGALNLEDREPSKEYIPVYENVLAHITEKTLWERTRQAKAKAGKK